MKLPMLWLSDWISCGLTSIELRDALTMLGLEVSGISDVDGESVLDLEITVNRGDALSIRGIARDLSCLLKIPLKMPSLASFSTPVGTSAITIEEPLSCPRYTGRLIFGVKVSESPEWIKKRLHLAGIRPINSIVDITNYILMDIGHPMHSFDYDKLIGGEIIVRKAKEGEEILALDGRVYSLDEDILVIADQSRPVAIGGVIGGQDTAVTSETKNILLEVAYFDPTLIRKASKKLGITTESSFRFERMVDPEGLVFAQDYATHLLLSLWPSAKAGKITDCFTLPIKEKTIVLRPDRVNKVLGTHISSDEMAGILSGLCFEVSQKEGAFDVKIPSFRGEIEREVDMIEEIVRLYGYDKTQETMPESPIIPHFNKEYQFIERILEIMVGCGLVEAINISFVGKDILSLFGFLEEDVVILLSPLSQDKCFMSPSLIPNLLETAQFNISYGNKNLSLFEIGKCFSKGTERWSLAGLMMGEIEKNWAGEGRDYLLADTFGVIKRLFSEIGAEPEFIQAETFFLKHCVRISDIGIAGIPNNDIISHFQLPFSPFLFELDLSKLFSLAKEKRYKEISRYPGIKIDLSLLVKKAVKSGAIAEAIKEASYGLAEEVKLYDIYEGKGVPSGFSAHTYSILYQSKERTLVMDEVEKIRDNTLKKLKNLFGVKPR